MARGSNLLDDPRRAAALAYALGAVTGLFLLIRGTDQPYVRFHAWQSILFTAFLALAVAGLRLVPIMGSVLVLGLIVVGALVWLALLVQAGRGRWFLLPLLGDIAFDRSGARP